MGSPRSASLSRVGSRVGFYPRTPTSASSQGQSRSESPIGCASVGAFREVLSANRFRKSKKRLAVVSGADPPAMEGGRTTADIDTTELMTLAQEVASSVAYVSQHSGKLSGGVQGRLNTAAMAFAEIVDALAAKTNIDEDNLQLRLDKQRLEREVLYIKADLAARKRHNEERGREVNALRAEKGPETIPFPDPGDIAALVAETVRAELAGALTDLVLKLEDAITKKVTESVTGSVTKLVGKIVNARIEGIQDRLLPEPVRRLPPPPDLVPAASGSGKVPRLTLSQSSPQIPYMQAVAPAARPSGSSRPMVLVGWTSARIVALAQRPLRCYKCMAIGHTRPMYPFTKERGETCLRCGEEEHRIGACTKTEFCCSVCADAGRRTNHLMGGSLTMRLRRF